MPQKQMTDIRSGPRYIATFPIRAEWDTADGVHIVSDGETENIGPDGTLVHLQRELPPVGTRVSLLVLGEVLRIERNPAHPQAALQLLGETDEWRGIVWKEAEIKMHEAENDYDEDELS